MNRPHWDVMRMQNNLGAMYGFVRVLLWQQALHGARRS